jgi:hypothetical protein
MAQFDTCPAVVGARHAVPLQTYLKLSHYQIFASLDSSNELMHTLLKGGFKMKNILLMFCFAMFLLSSSCGGTGHELKGGTPPKWVAQVRWACAIANQKGFCGVGSVSGIDKNQSLKITTAADRATAEIQKLFDQYTAQLRKDYQAATTDFSGTTEEQHIEVAAKNFTQGHLSGVEVRDRWEDEQGTLFVLAFLDIEAFKNAVDKMGNLNGKVRDFIKNNAEKSFEALSREEEKRETK